MLNLKKEYYITSNSNTVFWLTGLSGSGKTTLARNLHEYLLKQGHSSMVLDGDNIRHGLCSDLDFSVEDRYENLRRVTHVAKLLQEAGVNVIVSFISPLQESREYARRIIQNNFVEVYVKCDLEECEKRDVKGLYKKARAGSILNFTGIDSPYDVPTCPNITIDTTFISETDSFNILLQYISKHSLNLR